MSNKNCQRNIFTKRIKEQKGSLLNCIALSVFFFTLLTVARVTADMNMSCDIIMHARRLISSIRRRIETNIEATAIAHMLECS